MMRKKHLIQNNILNKTRENRNAKVTVQYIQEQQQLIQKSENTNNHNHLMQPNAGSTQEDLEIENVEYLEENPSVVEEYIEEPNEKDDLEDNFYPNAIHCLLDLYKTKYEAFNPEDSSVKVAAIWRAIAKDMQESFFEFNEHQIQQKYARLREQYFHVQSKEDAEHFDYFEQLHEIYQDPGKENVVKGLKQSKAVEVYYKDEILLQPEQLDITEENHLHDFKSEEIVHKEHEFIDMVEKELQAMEEGLHVESNKELAGESETIGEVSTEAKCSETAISPEEQQAQPLKRPLAETEPSLAEPQARKQKLNDYFEIKDQPFPSLPKEKHDFTLYHYNQHQERRHREKMSLLEKSLQLQERALEQQHQLLQELIKRLPSSS